MPFELIGFDADDTLWHNEGHYDVTQQAFTDILRPWVDPDTVAAALLETERRNLAVFGYGAKGFLLSMIETALAVTHRRIDGRHIEEIIGLGKRLMQHPVELLDGVADALAALSGRRLLLITKGELFHQESKVAASGVADRFERVEIVSEKDTDTYRRILDGMGVAPDAFCMVGNSPRSDIQPVLDLGGCGVHVPYHTTWALEQAELDDANPRMARAAGMSEVPAAIAALEVHGP